MGRISERLKLDVRVCRPSISESLYVSFIRSTTRSLNEEHGERRTLAVLSQWSTSMGLSVGGTNYQSAD